MEITDIKNMPNYNAVVKNGAESVSSGKAIWTEERMFATLSSVPDCIVVNQ